MQHVAADGDGRIFQDVLGRLGPAAGRIEGSPSACGRDCSTCPKKLTCPFSHFVTVKSEGGRA